MKTLLILSLIMTCGLVSEVKAQTRPTRIVRLEVDKKEIKTSYRVFFLSNGKWIEAAKTSDGFMLPEALQNEEHVTLRITFGKHTLDFEKVHISNFRVDWTVGVDTKPFSKEFVEPGQERLIQQVYYIVFDGEPERQFVVTKWKKR